MIQRTLFLSLVLLYPLGPLLADDWPQWRGPDRTGVSKETRLLQSWPSGGPKLLWTFRDAGVGDSSMAIVGDRLYCMGAKDNKEYVFAVDLNTQKKLWSVKVGVSHRGWPQNPTCTPTVDGNLLYAIGSHGHLVCVDTTIGKKVWSQEMEASLGGTAGKYGYCESPLVDGDQVVATLGGQTNVLVAFDKKNGKLKWRSTIYTRGGADADYSSITSMMVVESGGVRQYVHVAYRFDANVIGVRASDGKVLWQIPSPCTVNTPIYHNGCVYVSGGYCKLIKLKPDGNSCKVDLIYDKHEMENEHGGVVLVGDYLFGFTQKGHVWMCQDFKTGKAMWRGKPSRKKFLGRASVTYADGNLYCYHYVKGDVLLLKATPDGYKEQGKFRIPQESKLPHYGAGGDGGIFAHPVVANGKLYLRDLDVIFCYDVRKPQ